MPYCPNCKYEYTDGTTVCPDCQQTLLAGSPPPAVANPDDEIDSVTLLETYDPMGAQLLAGALEEADIPYQAKGLGLTDSIGGAIGAYVPQGSFSSPGPIVVRVNPEDYDRAKEIMESLQGDEISEEENIDTIGEDE